MNTIGPLLVDAARRWKEGIATAVEPIGLTANAYLLLSAYDSLHQKRLPPSQAAAARLTKLDVNVTAQEMKFLAEHHLINRTTSKIDTRSYDVTLTLAGTQLLHVARTAVQNFEKQFYASIEPKHFAEALRSLTK